MPSNSEYRDFATLILPFLNDLDFTKGKCVSHIPFGDDDYHYHCRSKIDGLFYSIRLSSCSELNQLLLQVSNVPDITRSVIPCYRKRCCVILKSQAKYIAVSDYLREKYIFKEYQIRSYRPTLCIHCDSSIMSSMDKHIASMKHKNNIVKYNLIIKEILFQSGQLNDNVLNDILSFL